MNNQQQNFFINQQQQSSDQYAAYNQILQWQMYNSNFQQSSYQQQQQPFIHQGQQAATATAAAAGSETASSSSQFSIPPPPPPENNHQQQPPQPSSMSNQQQMNARNSSNNQGNHKSSTNSNNNNNGNNNRGKQNNRGSNWRGKFDQRGNGRGGGTNSRFGGSENSNQHSNNNSQSHNNENNNQQGNFNDSNQQQQQHQGNLNNSRGKIRKNNYNFRHNSEVAPRAAFMHQAVEYQNNSNASLLSSNDEPQTQEDIAFEEEFKKWELQFEEWKEQNKNHPDKKQYQTYERQFMEVRDKLLSRREEMRRRKVQMSGGGASKTAEQLAFESQWNAGTPIIEEKSSNATIQPTRFDPKPISSSQLPPPSSSTAASTSVAAAKILFGESSSTKSFSNKQNADEDFQNDSFAIDNRDDFSSFDDSIIEKSSANSFEDRKFSHEHKIPGLEMVPEKDDEQPKRTELEVIDLEDEVENAAIRFPPPKHLLERKPKENEMVPLPRFRPRVQRNMIDIDQLLEEPHRYNRPNKIMILIRGPPGSGKHYLANLIYQREREMGNERTRVLSISEFFDDVYVPIRNDEYNLALYTESRKLVREGYIDFIIVVLNGCTIQQFNKVSHTAQTIGHYTCFSIEVHQTREICEKHNVNRRSLTDIINGIEDLDRYPTPVKITIVDPTSILKPILGNKSHPMPKPTLPSSSSADPTTISDFATKMAQILQNSKVIEILQQQLTPQPQQQQQLAPLMPQNFSPNFNQHNNNYPQNFNQQNNYPQNRHQSEKENLCEPNDFIDYPSFKPAKVIDYDHEHIPTLEEQLLEFRVIRIIEYNHRDNQKLRDFVKDIDVDRIIEKRKAVALRKKILEYLRNAERPEDTVSNPKYPKNWEEINVERPARRNKRKKKLTPKIKRILMERSREENSWMTKGYTKLDYGDKMDLEEISDEEMSDDAMDTDDVIPNKIQIVEQKVVFLPKYHDEYKTIVKTTPDFNHFNHQNVLDIKKLLWLPDRKSRPNRILIILRGCSGSGKSHSIQLIKRKESEMGNAAIRILSIDDYFLTEDDELRDAETQKQLTQSYLEEMQKHLRKTITDSLHNFIIIDAENCDINSYNQFHQIGSSMSFTVYAIELYQTLDICVKQCKRLHSSNEIAKSIELLDRNRIPSSHMLLIPSALYAEYKCFVNPQILKNQDIFDEIEEKETTIDTYRKFLVQTIDEKCSTTSMPQFNCHNRDIIDIEEILEEPARFKRNENIAILLRGPGGSSGKNQLAMSIIEKERQYGNEKCKFISIEEYFINELTQKYEFNNRLIEANVDKLMRQLREVMRSKNYKFLIIDAETGDFSHYKQVHDLITSYQYQCYTIELYQDSSICAASDIHNRPAKEFDSILEGMELNPTPSDHILLNASCFFKESSSTSDRPLKSALKISPNTSLNIQLPKSKNLLKFYDEHFTKKTIHEKYQAQFNQRLNINGEFVLRNSTPPSKLPEFNWFNKHCDEINELLEGENRPEKNLIFIRGAPGSGKTFLSRLIERKEIERGNGDYFKLLSIDEQFEKHRFCKANIDGHYENFIESEANASKINEYMDQLKRDFNNSIGEYSFIVVDGEFCDLKYYIEMWNVGKSNGYTCHTIELNQDDDICLKYNNHKWDKEFVLKCTEMMRKIQTPVDHKLLDPELLYDEYKYDFNTNGDLFPFDENTIISDVSDDEDDFMSDDEPSSSFGKFRTTAMSSKWDDVEAPNIERLDGTMKKSLHRLTMADYLQTDEWSMRPSTSGKKRVRWADIEEKKVQERMREIGFIVGQTDWNRMVDDSDGKNALEKTKYIERRNKN